MPVGTNINFDPLQTYDYFFGNHDSGSAGDDARFMNDFAWKQSLRNEEFQKQLSEHGIKMRVDDAVSAGLHPLVGAGINPSQGGFSTPAFTGTPTRFPKQPSGISMGADISRAVSATSTLEEKQLRALELQRAINDTKRSGYEADIAARQLKMMGSTPPMPNKYQSVMKPDGTTEAVYSSDYSQAIMSDPLGMWANSFKKAFGGPDNEPFWKALYDTGRMAINPWRYK